MNPAPHLMVGGGGHLTATYLTFPNQRPLVLTCHSHLLTGNWVFIRLPARGQCSVYLTQLSRIKGEASLLPGNCGVLWLGVANATTGTSLSDI